VSARAWLTSVAAALVLCGCERGMHDMYAPSAYRSGSDAARFDDHVATRRPPPGTVPTSGTASMPATAAITPAVLERGRDRYTVYCAPCHGTGGDGDGMVVRRGFPAPPSYHEPRLRSADDRHLYDVIAHGWGVMYPYGDRVAPADRQAIVAYIRALQFSRHAPVDRLEPSDLARLRDLPGSGGAR